jgi:hypothetical protein
MAQVMEEENFVGDETVQPEEIEIEQKVSKKKSNLNVPKKKVGGNKKAFKSKEKEGQEEKMLIWSENENLMLMAPIGEELKEEEFVMENP